MKSKKQRRVFVVVTLLTISMLAGTIFLCARAAGEEMTQHSFDELTRPRRCGSHRPAAARWCAAPPRSHRPGSPR